MLAEGKACVRNHRRVLQNIRRVMAWARMKNVRVVSTEQIYAKSDRKHTYCIMGTDGCCKIPYTVRSNNIVFPADGCTDLPRDILKNYDQIILHKRCVNPFDEPRADRVHHRRYCRGGGQGDCPWIAGKAKECYHSCRCRRFTRPGFGGDCSQAGRGQRRQTRRNQSDVGQFMPETRGRLRLRPLPGQNAEEILRRQCLRYISKSMSAKCGTGILPVIYDLHDSRTVSSAQPCLAWLKCYKRSNVRPCSCLTGSSRREFN